MHVHYRGWHPFLQPSGVHTFDESVAADIVRTIGTPASDCDESRRAGERRR